ncbi:MAG TPA: Rieske 2Fe-2S domain-containing protein [Corynebacterium sp.]|nr:Rieske 2Fe-2S domain-containing protein [Corynebacterium sp.]
MDFVNVGRAEDVAEGHAIVVPAEKTGHRQAIAVFRQGEEFFAVDDECTHLGASLGEEGRRTCAEGVIKCWLHQGTFDVRTGEAIRYPARGRLTTHPVEVRDGELWISVR